MSANCFLVRALRLLRVMGNNSSACPTGQSDTVPPGASLLQLKAPWRSFPGVVDDDGTRLAGTFSSSAAACRSGKRVGWSDAPFRFLAGKTQGDKKRQIIHTCGGLPWRDDLTQESQLCRK